MLLGKSRYDQDVDFATLDERRELRPFLARLIGKMWPEFELERAPATRVSSRTMPIRNRKLVRTGPVPVKVFEYAVAALRVLV
jgi:hypothetical protein